MDEEIRRLLEAQRLAASKYMDDDDEVKLISKQEKSLRNNVNNKPVVVDNKSDDLLPCPICTKTFKSSDIESHVNACLDGGVKDSPQKNCSTKTYREETRCFSRWWKVSSCSRRILSILATKDFATSRR